MHSHNRLSSPFQANAGHTTPWNLQCSTGSRPMKKELPNNKATVVMKI